VIVFGDMASTLVFSIHHLDGRSIGPAQIAPPLYFRLSAIAQVRAKAAMRSKH
jgi:hypothetical protein